MSVNVLSTVYKNKDAEIMPLNRYHITNTL